MIGKLILVAATGTFFKGFMQLRKERFLGKIFNDVEKMQIYNLDYMKSLEDLPQNQHFLICAKVQPNDNSKTYQNLSTPTQSLLLRCFLPTLPLVANLDPEKPKLGRLWKTFQQLNFNLVGGENNDLVLNVQPTKKQSLICFALNSYREDIKSTELENLRDQTDLNRLEQRVQKNSLYTEYGIEQNKHYVFCSDLQSPNIVQPLIVMGENKEAFLDALDAELVKLATSAKIYFGISIGILLLHLLIFKQLFKKKQKKIPKIDEEIKKQ